MRKEIEIRVYGRVQGVNFRYSIFRKAEDFGLKGYVFNRSDGSVEVIAQGSGDKIKELLYWIQKNPGFSRVDGVNYLWRKESKKFDKFEILRTKPFLADQVKSFLNLGKYFLKKNDKAPAHVAIIPDGNRRWAKSKGEDAVFGHYTSSSFQHINELFAETESRGVKYLTLWGFSTENWKRDKKEIDGIMKLILHIVEQWKENADVHNIRFRHLGRKDRLPIKLLTALTELENKTAKCTGLNVQLCIDYGGQDEIVRAVNKLLKKKVKKINEKELSACLDSHDIPPVDFIIRTSGERRLSGFMPIHSAYAELYFSEVHFPDFGINEFREALNDYSRRKRRFGGS